jgi:hypothetical protein
MITIKVTLEYHDPFYTLVPVESDLTQQIIAHLSEYGVASDGCAVFYDIPDFIKERASVKRFLKNGDRSVTFLADPWELGYIYGYDNPIPIHTIFE